MVYAVTDKEFGARGGVTCFLVEKDTPGDPRISGRFVYRKWRLTFKVGLG